MLTLGFMQLSDYSIGLLPPVHLLEFDAISACMCVHVCSTAIASYEKHPAFDVFLAHVETA